MPPKSTEENASPSAVKVYVRVRPFIEREIALGDDQPIVTPYKDSCQSIKLLDPHSYYKPRDVCNFDECWFSMPDHKEFPYVSQDDIYRKTGADACANVFAGYNACIMAYGQTGSGKTHTMLGDLMKTEERGIISRVCDELFSGCARSNGSMRLQCTYYEIYNERVVDLLDRSSREELRVRNDPVLGPYVEGLSTHRIQKGRDVMHLLNIGNKERHIALTKLSKHSSRSHAVLTLQLIKNDSGKIFSKLHLVDLAGSERTSMSEVEGVHFKEATKINLSLTTLGRVIDALADQANGITGTLPPYRESLLTWLLSDSLGGNSKTCMIATISPASVNFDETLNTLRYASRAREIVNICVTNDDPYEKRVKELTALVDYLRKQLTSQNESQAYRKEERIDDIVDSNAASHYQEIISKLHHQVSKLSKENHELEKKFKDEKSAHMLTIQSTHQETTAMRKELEMFRSFSSLDVLSVKKGNKCLDLSSLKNSGRKTYENSDSSGFDGRRSISSRPRTSVSRVENLSQETKIDPGEYLGRIIERYARELNRLQKDYCSKGNEIIEVHTSKLVKVLGHRTPRMSIRNSPRYSKSETNLAEVRDVKRNRQLLHLVHFSIKPEFDDRLHALEEAHELQIQEINIAHNSSREEDKTNAQDKILQLEDLIEQLGQKLTGIHNERTESEYFFRKIVDEKQMLSLLLLEKTERTGINDLQESNFQKIQDNCEYVAEARDQRHTIQTLQSEIVAFQNAYNKENQKLKESMNQRDEQTQQSHLEAIETIRESHMKEIREIQRSSEVLVENIRKENLQSLEDQRAHHEGMLQEQAKQLEDELKKERDLHRSRETELKEEVEQRFLANILKPKEEETNEKIASLEREHNALIDSIEKGKESELCVLKQEHIVRENTLQQKHEGIVKNIREEFAKEILQREKEFNGKLDALKEEKNHELVKIESRAAEKLKEAEKDKEKAQSDASLHHETEQKIRDAQHEEQVQAMREGCNLVLEKVHNLALSNHASVEAHQRLLLVEMHAEMIKSIYALRNTSSQLIEDIQRSFDQRSKFIRKTKDESIAHCMDSGAIEVSYFCAKYQSIFETMNSMNKKNIFDRQTALIECSKLRDEVRKHIQQFRCSTGLAMNEVNESQERLRIFGMKLDKTISLHRRFFEEKRACAMKEIKLHYTEELKRERNQLQSKCDKSLGQLSEFRERNVRDQKVVGKQISTFNKFLTMLGNSMSSWQAQQCELVGSMFSEMCTTRNTKVLTIYEETARRFTETRDRDREIAQTELNNSVKAMQRNMTALQKLFGQEALSRERITLTEVQSLQDIYSFRSIAWLEREEKLCEAIHILERASEVAADSAKKQQSVIRKLESSIELYKVLQLEGELGMQSGISHSGQ